jgi:hypothetical protein
MDRSDLAGLVGQLEIVPIGYALNPSDLAEKLTDESRSWGSYENQEQLLIELIVAIDEKMKDEGWSYDLRAKLG